MLHRLSGWLLLLAFPLFLSAETSPERIRTLIEQWQEDPRGPYRDIMWFCDDGTFIKPRTVDCPTGGVQRARYKPELIDLQRTDHLFLAQILSTTNERDFWDARNYNSRMKQYLLGVFLANADDGWVNRTGQYYRGAFQVEDEVEWGTDFLQGVLASDSNLDEHWFLLLQAARVVPHGEDDDRSQRVRALSKSIAEHYPKFMNLRIKIHGQPDASDLPASRAFLEEHREKLRPGDRDDFETMLADMEIMYAPVDLNSLQKFIRQLPNGSAARTAAETLLSDHADREAGATRAVAIAETLRALRQNAPEVRGGRARLALVDLVNALDRVLFREIPEWQVATVADAVSQNCHLVMAANATGFLSNWEYDRLKPELQTSPRRATWADLNDHLAAAQRAVEWGTGTVRGVFHDVVSQYTEFEPMAYGYYDDLIRSSVLLPLGNNLGTLSEFIGRAAGLKNDALGLKNENQIRGINPGYARGELVVISGSAEGMEVDKNKVYAFERPPSDLKPVAGILTVTEGNVVSHVSLLARNLGIPNAVISPENLADLEKFNGEEVFYAVSNAGTIVLREASDMKGEEKDLFDKRERNDNKVTVPVEKMDLSQRSVLNMRNVKSKDSGKIVGPKAANLGQLKEMFPEQVVEGIVIPFGIFRMHLDQAMPGGSATYWDHLNQIFQGAKRMEADGLPEADVERYQVEQLAAFQEKIKDIALLPEFERDFRSQFAAAFGAPLGQVPVFLRSDTNMEDLPEFTGAGLNLTLFNVLDADEILAGIKRVWASPYSERSFKWRQRYLLNPENVFPSILVIPSVNVDKSGVLITKGVGTGTDADLTAAFSRGVGGAVDGQSAETYLLRPDAGEVLLSPARDPQYRTIPPSGGSRLEYATFDRPVLSDRNRADLRTLAADVQQRLPNAPGIETDGPWDVELGFKDDKIWLFQVRPFVENKNAKTSAYLESITPARPDRMLVRTDQPLEGEFARPGALTMLLHKLAAGLL